MYPTESDGSTVSENSTTSAIELRVRGSVDAVGHAYAETRIAEVLNRHALRDGAVVRLAGAACGRGPGLVQVNVRVYGAPARIQVPGPSLAAAVDTAAIRLDHQIRRLTTGENPRQWPDPQRRPLATPFLGEVRRIKDVAVRTSSACQALAAMNAMDYDVHLYHDAQTGDDAVVYRSGPTGTRLARQHHMGPPMSSDSVAITVSAHRTPELSIEAAGVWLADGWLPFLFFTDPVTRRGRLLYRRYDGQLTLVQPDIRSR
jgi:hypothetical protein